MTFRSGIIVVIEIIIKYGKPKGLKYGYKTLESFSTVARAASFRKASKTLGYAQPTVSTHIQLLEKEYGIKLFERLGHKIKLTQEGEKPLFYVDNILKYLYEASEAFANYATNGTIPKKITIGANESFSVIRLPA